MFNHFKWSLFCNRMMPKLMSSLKTVQIKISFSREKLLKQNLQSIYPVICFVYYIFLSLLSMMATLGDFCKSQSLNSEFLAFFFFFSEEQSFSDFYSPFMTNLRRLPFMQTNLPKSDKLFHDSQYLIQQETNFAICKQGKLGFNGLCCIPIQTANLNFRLICQKLYVLQIQ